MGPRANGSIVRENVVGLRHPPPGRGRKRWTSTTLTRAGYDRCQSPRMVQSLLQHRRLRASALGYAGGRRPNPSSAAPVSTTGISLWRRTSASSSASNFACALKLTTPSITRNSRVWAQPRNSIRPPALKLIRHSARSPPAAVRGRSNSKHGLRFSKRHRLVEWVSDERTACAISPRCTDPNRQSVSL